MTDRTERLRSDAAELKVASSGRRDGLYQTGGAVAMVLGVVLAFLAYQVSLGKDDPRDIQSLIILAITMLALAVAGGAVFLRYSLARFLRFWLLRQLVEGQDHIDQVVAALGRPVSAAASTSDRNASRPDADRPDASGPLDSAPA